MHPVRSRIRTISDVQTSACTYTCDLEAQCLGKLDKELILALGERKRQLWSARRRHG